jgi:transcriptional antiterminator/mannitol/fructose-specific phosphotransferase system IIA component (Ntr-type)
MTLDQRKIELLTKLASSHDYISINTLAKSLKVSPRTIRYDLEKIDDYLLDKSSSPLVRKPGVGIALKDDKCLKDKIIKSISKMGNFQYVPSPQERIRFILWILIFQSNYITINQIAKELLVSRSTIIKDLEEVRNWLKKYDLELKTSTKKGIKIDGSEAEIRRKAIEILTKQDIAAVKILGKLSVKNQDVEFLSKIFKDLDITRITECIRKAELMLRISFTDQAFINIILHVGVAIKRIKLGKQIRLPPVMLISLKRTKEYLVAKEISHVLGQSLHLVFPENEIGYIAVHFLGANLSRVSYQDDLYDINYQLLCARFIKEVSKKIALDLTNDERLYKGILAHIKPTVFRLKHDLKLENPIKKEVIHRDPNLFKVVKNSLKPLERYTSCPINDDEVTYFLIHVMASIEKLKGKHSKLKRALIICGSGVGTSEMLSIRLRSIFQVKIVDCIPYHQLNWEIAQKAVDLVISTIPLEHFCQAYCLISPFLNKKDIHKLSKYLSFNTHFKFTFNGDLKSFLDIIKKHCRIVDKVGLVNDLSKILNESSSHDVYLKGGEKPVLIDLLTKRTMKLNVPARDWEDAVAKGGKLLISAGCADQCYVDAMINSVKKLGPYIVIAPGIAMPHAQPGCGTKKVGMSLITLKDPVNFGNKVNDPVTLVICLCSTDHTTHLKALSELVTLLKNQNIVDEINKAETVDEIVEMINRNKVSTLKKEEK